MATSNCYFSEREASKTFEEVRKSVERTSGISEKTKTTDFEAYRRRFSEEVESAKRCLKRKYI